MSSLLVALLITGGCGWYMPPPFAIPGAASLVFDVTPATTQPVTTIAVSGPLQLRRAQLSGLAWYGDTLVLLPQFPEQFDHQIFTLPKAAIVEQLTGRDLTPLEPQAIIFDDAAIQAQLVGSEGYEALAFAGDNVFLTIESRRLSGMLGFVVAGTMVPGENRLVLDPTRLTPIKPQADLDNIADEALLLIDQQVLTIYEANGLAVNADPVAHLFDSATLTPIGVTPLPQIEYRITDATALDEAGRFWVTNSFAPETSGLRTFLRSHGAIGAVNPLAQPVERLLEFAVTPQGIVRTETPPIALTLQPRLGGNGDQPRWVARNWEGVVRLDTVELHGFLLVTDFSPETIVAFVPLP